METKLKKLFDYQKFENNEKLSAMLADAESRNCAELSMDDLKKVSGGKKLVSPDAGLKGAIAEVAVATAVLFGIEKEQ